MSRSRYLCQIRIGIPVCVMSCEYFTRTSLYLVRLKMFKWIKFVRRHLHQIQANWVGRDFITASRENSRLITHARMRRKFFFCLGGCRGEGVFVATTKLHFKILSQAFILWSNSTKVLFWLWLDVLFCPFGDTVTGTSHFVPRDPHRWPKGSKLWEREWSNGATLRWLNTVLRAVSGSACFKLDKQTWRRKKQWYTDDDFSKSTL